MLIEEMNLFVALTKKSREMSFLKHLGMSFHELKTICWLNYPNHFLVSKTVYACFVTKNTLVDRLEFTMIPIVFDKENENVKTSLKNQTRTNQVRHLN